LDTHLYAIGDVHGEAIRLGHLHEAIFETHKLMHGDAPLTLVHLGDYVDRGPDSFGVIETLQKLEASDRCALVNLRGNHEQMMLDAVNSDNDYDFWLSNGGTETLKSYAAAGFQSVPDAHLEWLADLPTLHIAEAERLIFVHAGIDISIWPQTRSDVHLWTRSKRFFNAQNWDNPELENWCVVHGHTPTDGFHPETEGTPARRINLDTGAVYGGPLTAAKFSPGQPPRFLYG